MEARLHRAYAYVTEITSFCTHNLKHLIVPVGLDYQTDSKLGRSKRTDVNCTSKENRSLGAVEWRTLQFEQLPTWRQGNDQSQT